jgi:hypothetical protein
VRQPLVWGIPLLALSWAALFAVHPFSDDSVNDFGVYEHAAGLMADGYLPYSDFAFEYPPLAAPVMALPGLAATGEAYEVAFGLAMFSLAVCALVLVRRLALASRGNERLAVAGFALSPLLLGAIARNHFDILPVVLTLGALAALVSRRVTFGFVLLGLGAMTKLFPLAIAPVAIAWLWARGERDEALRGAAALAATLAVVGAAWVALSPGGALDAVAYHAERPVQVESLPAVALHAADVLGADAPRSVDSHRSDGLEHPLDSLIAALLAGAGFAMVAALALGAARARTPAALVLASLAAVACFAAFGKVLSPQFLVWALPLLALALAWRMWALAGALAGAAALTLAEFPSRYFDIVAMEPGALWLLAARDLALVAAVALAARQLAGSRICSMDRASPSSPDSISTALSQGSSSDVSKRTGIWVRKRVSA